MLILKERLQRHMTFAQLRQIKMLDTTLTCRPAVHAARTAVLGKELANIISPTMYAREVSSLAGLDRRWKCFPELVGVRPCRAGYALMATSQDRLCDVMCVLHHKENILPYLQEIDCLGWHSGQVQGASP